MTIKDQRPRTGIRLPVAKAMLPFLLFVAVRPLMGLGSPPNAAAHPFLFWLLPVTADLAFILHFALFAAGVVLWRKLGGSRRLFRAAATVGILMGAASYVLGAWAKPVMMDRWLAPNEELAALGGTPQTPLGIVRHLRFIEANPPDEYSLRNEAPRQWPPNALRWELHIRVAWVVFGLINVLLGILTAALTADLTRGRRRNACLGIGFVSAIVFLVCAYGVAPPLAFTRGGTMLPGIVAAWGPLAVPAAGALLLGFLVRRKMYG